MIQLGKHGIAHEGGPQGGFARGVSLAFVIVAFAIMLVPAVGMLWAPTESTTENRTLAAAPSITAEDGSFNVNILSDAGMYFEDHFAYRNAMVSANAFLRALAGTSATDEVVVGTDGWLYYGGTLYDYLGQNVLSDRALVNVAHNLALMQGYAQSRGAQFLFTVAPNKNSLYASHMPYYYLAYDGASNWERLKPYLTSYGVNYYDLFELFEGQDAELYYERDTHWNNTGALLAANALLGAFSRGGLTVADYLWVDRDDYTGDVAQMLYPQNPGTEAERYVTSVNDGEGKAGTTWSYTQGADVTDNSITTTGMGSGSLLMYRDSFGNALIPYLSTVFGQATYSKLIPYNALTIDEVGADCVIVERAERHLAYLAQAAPLMLSPSLTLAAGTPAADDARASETTLEVSTNGPYTVLEGALDARLANVDARIYVELEDAAGARMVYEAFDVSRGLEDESVDTEQDAAAASNSEQAATDYGYAAYIDSAAIDLASVKARVFIVVDGVSYGMKTFSGLDSLLQSNN